MFVFICQIVAICGCLTQLAKSFSAVHYMLNGPISFLICIFKPYSIIYMYLLINLFLFSPFLCDVSCLYELLFFTVINVTIIFFNLGYLFVIVIFHYFF